MDMGLIYMYLAPRGGKKIHVHHGNEVDHRKDSKTWTVICSQDFIVNGLSSY